jgi:hypothetical protein
LISILPRQRLAGNASVRRSIAGFEKTAACVPGLSKHRFDFAALLSLLGFPHNSKKMAFLIIRKNNWVLHLIPKADYLPFDENSLKLELCVMCFPHNSKK